MFRSSTILRELLQSMAKLTLMLKHSVKLRRCILCGDVEACREMVCVLFVVQTDTKSKAQMTAEGQSDKMASDMEVRMKQRCVIEFPMRKKLHPMTFTDAC